MKKLPITIQELLSRAFNLTALEKTRLPWVDYLKGIAILLVVYRHVLIGIERNGIDIPTSLVNANMIFYSFRMPLFFILSGVFISMSLSKRNLNKILSLKFENLLYPYLVWSIIQITIQIVFSGSTNASRGLVDYTYILYQPRNLDQFWYLPALFNTTLVYLLVKTKLKPPAWAQLFLGLVLYFASPYFQRVSMISDWMEFYFFFALGDAITSFFFKESTQQFIKRPILLLLLIPIFVLVQMYYLRHDEYYYLNDPVGKTEFMIIALTGCFSMVVLSFRLQSLGILRFLRVLGYHSIYIYVMHVIAAACIRIVLTNVLGIYNPIVLLICGILFGVITPVIFYNLLVRDNIFWFLFSTHRPKTKQAPVKKAPKIPASVDYKSTAG